MAENVSSDHLVRGADIAARAALDAPERLAERWILPHGGAAVVDENEVELLRAVHADLRLELDVRGTRRARDELRVGADLLAGRAAREELQDRGGGVERRNDLLHADDGDVHRGKACRQVGVALVRDEDERARVGDEDVAAGDADVRLEERAAKLIARDRDKGGRVVADRMSDDFREQRGDLLARLVDRRRDEVGWALAGELDDPFAEVGLDGGDAIRREVFVELDLLG